MPKRQPLAHDAQLMKMARSVARWESKVRTLGLALREARKQLKAERRTFRTYAQSITDREWNEQAPPLRTFGER